MAGGTRGASAPPVLGPVDQPVPSATPIGLEAADSITTKESNMPDSTQATPGDNPARQIATFFGAIADTLDWHYTDWLALDARLQACGTPIAQLTLQQVHDAITGTARAMQGGGR